MVSGESPEAERTGRPSPMCRVLPGRQCLPGQPHAFIYPLSILSIVCTWLGVMRYKLSPTVFDPWHRVAVTWVKYMSKHKGGVT